jgi:hypothetical protein
MTVLVICTVQAASLKNLPLADELLRPIVVAWVKLVGAMPCAFADCSEIADEQVLTWTLKATVPKRRPVMASVCVTEVSPVEATVITGLPMVVSS